MQNQMEIDRRIRRERMKCDVFTFFVNNAPTLNGHK